MDTTISGACSSSWFLDLTPRYQSRPRRGPKSRTFSSLLRTTYYSSVYRPSSTSIMMTALDLVYSCMPRSPHNSPTPSPSCIARQLVPTGVQGWLPSPNLHLHGLANSIHQNAQAWLRDIATPCAWHIKGNLLSIQRNTLIRLIRS
jgi:hypothetical protein